MSKPSFWKRVKYAITGGKTVSATRPLWQIGQPEYAIDVKFEPLIREGYRRNELIYACINRTASTGSSIHLRLENKKTGEMLDEHPLLDFMERPNPDMARAEFWGAVIIYQKAAGRALFEIERTNGGAIAALWPLRPDYMQIIPDSARPSIRQYIYTVPGTEPKAIDPKNILDFPLFDPLDQYKSWPPLAVAARVGDVDNHTTDFIKMLWEHGGQPMGLLKSTQVLTDDDVTDIRRRWSERYGGYENWMEPAVLDRDAEYQRTGMTFQEMGFDSLDARNEIRICEALDVPPILVGAKVGLDRSTYSNFEQAQRAWWQNSIAPMYDSFMDVLTHKLLPQFGLDGWRLIWDASKVPALQENLDNLWKRTLDGFTRGAFTLNQTLDLLGQDTQTNGDYYLRPSGVTMVPLSDADVKPEPPPQLVQPAPGEDDTNTDTAEGPMGEETEEGDKSYDPRQVDALKELARALETNQPAPVVNVTVNLPDTKPVITEGVEDGIG